MSAGGSDLILVLETRHVEFINLDVVGLPILLVSSDFRRCFEAITVEAAHMGSFQILQSINTNVQNGLETSVVTFTNSDVGFSTMNLGLANISGRFESVIVHSLDIDVSLTVLVIHLQVLKTDDHLGSISTISGSSDIDFLDSVASANFSSRFLTWIVHSSHYNIAKILETTDFTKMEVVLTTSIINEAEVIETNVQLAVISRERALGKVNIELTASVVDITLSNVDLGMVSEVLEA